MSDPTNHRKIRHIEVIQAEHEADRRKFYFDDVHLKHRALPELNLKDIDPSIIFMGKTLSFPLVLSSMTGGDHDLVRKVNRNLAEAAEATGVAMAVGSQRVMFTNPEARSSFEVRPYAPSTLLFSNLGAVQLNYGFTLDMCEEALEVSEADALYLHLNPLQEAVQSDGNTNFAGLAEKIQEINERLGRPLILKEVGAGFSEEDVRLAMKGGIKYIDIAGSGGTSWSRIEYHSRREKEPDNLGLIFQDWGIPTPQALLALKPYRDRLTLIASGGVRTGIDMVKAMILGATLCGMAAPFLQPAMESKEKVIEIISRLKKEFVTAMFLLGVENTKGLMANESLLR